MSQFLVSVSYWLHSLSTVIFIGYFLLLALLYLPAFAGHLDNAASGILLGELSRRSRPWIYASLVVFILTGIYLMLVNTSYLGLGNFGNTWSLLMLVKHILVVGMIIVGVFYNAVLRIGPQITTGIDTAAAFSRFKQYAYIMSILGGLVLLLTAISQAQ